MQKVIELLKEIRRLMQLRGDSPFKVSAYEKAVKILEGRKDLEDRAKQKTLTELPGIGLGIASVIEEYLLDNSSGVRDELLSSIPSGMLEFTQIPGLGPKKARTLIEQLGIQSLAELEYACHENRLVSLKGFGVKAQAHILEGILFQKSHLGFQCWSDVNHQAQKLLEYLSKACGGLKVSLTGAFRRRLEIFDCLEFLIEKDSQLCVQALAEQVVDRFFKDQGSQSGSFILVKLHWVHSSHFGYELAKTTATEAHWKALGSPAYFEAETEEAFYQKLSLPWISPELRETGEEVELARAGKLDQLLSWDGIRGVFHNHTTRSDGTASLEEMVREADRLGYEYIGISDHSQSAFYAQGLREADLKEQETEVQRVQAKYPKIRVFWGIESDILADGSLDYSPQVLEKFDFVIASVHSRLQMNREQMTDRILKAIQNPYTRFLGHPTGRLLLGRKAADFDMEAVITEAARCEVAVETNANPARLDLDWRWGPQMRATRAWTSVNPDAHSTQGLKDTCYGVAVARKALLPATQVLNTKTASEVEQWFKRVSLR